MGIHKKGNVKCIWKLGKLTIRVSTHAYIEKYQPHTGEKFVDIFIQNAYQTSKVRLFKNGALRPYTIFTSLLNEIQSGSFNKIKDQIIETIDKKLINFYHIHGNFDIGIAKYEKVLLKEEDAEYKDGRHYKLKIGTIAYKVTFITKTELPNPNNNEICIIGWGSNYVFVMVNDEVYITNKSLKPMEKIDERDNYLQGAIIKKLRSNKLCYKA